MIDLSQYHLERGDALQMVEKLNAVIDAIQGASNDTTETVDNRLDDQDAILAALSGAMTSGVTFKGVHDASTAAYPSSPSNGDYWIISVAGTISNVYLNVGDAIIYYSSDWIRLPANPSMKEINPLAKAVRVAMTSSGSVPGIRVLHNAKFDITGDFTIHRTIYLYSSEVGLTPVIVSKASGSSANFQLDVGTGAQRLPRMILPSSPSAVSANATEAIPLAAYDRFADLTVKGLVSGSDVLVSFYVDGIKLGDTVTVVGADLSIVNTGDLYIGGYSAGRTNSEQSSETILLNRAMSDSEILALSINGPALADIGARNENLLTAPSDFADAAWVGSSNGTGSNPVVTSNVATDPDGGGNADKIVFDRGVGNTLSDSSSIAESNIPVIVGKNHCGGLWIKAFDTPDVGKQVGVRHAGGSAYAVYTLTSGWTQVKALEVSGISLAGFEIANRGGVTADNSVSVLVYGASFKPSGVTLWLNAEDCQGDTGQIFDRSGNGNHAKLPASGAKRIPEKREFEIRWTNTWDGTHEAQYVGGVNEEIFPDGDIWIDSWTYKIAGSTIEDVKCGDGSDDDRFVANTTGLAAGTGRFTLANNTTDGTNRKATIDPDANFTGSISSTIRGYILES